MRCNENTEKTILEYNGKIYPFIFFYNVFSLLSRSEYQEYRKNSLGYPGNGAKKNGVNCDASGEFSTVASC